MALAMMRTCLTTKCDDPAVVEIEAHGNVRSARHRKFSSSERRGHELPDLGLGRVKCDFESLIPTISIIGTLSYRLCASPYISNLLSSENLS
jgi:hypothetical protein